MEKESIEEELRNVWCTSVRLWCSSFKKISLFKILFVENWIISWRIGWSEKNYRGCIKKVFVSSIEHNTVQYNTKQYYAIQYATQHNTDNTTQYNTVNTTQYNVIHVQYNTTHWLIEHFCSI